MRALACLMCCSLLACSRNSTPIDSDSPPPAASAPTESAPAAPAAPPHAAPAPGAAAAPQAAGASHAGGLAWTAGEPLQARTPKSSMRAAEYGVQGDEQAELSVFYFGPGQGGSVDANVTRWLGQISQPDGSDTAAQAKRGENKVNGVAVATVEAHGTYSGGMAMAGAPAAAAIPNAIMLGAIATGPQGPVFFKLIGPADSVERARPAFDALVASLHAE